MFRGMITRLEGPGGVEPLAVGLKGHPQPPGVKLRARFSLAESPSESTLR